MKISFSKFNFKIEQKLCINNNYDVNRKILNIHKNHVFGRPCAIQKIQTTLPYLNNYCSEIKVPQEHFVLAELRICIRDDSDSIYFYAHVSAMKRIVVFYKLQLLYCRI